VLTFVALDITIQAFHAVPVRHAPAVAISFVPSIARLVWIELSNPEFVPAARLAQLLGASGGELPALAVILALGNGFIVTATLWGAFMVELTERRLRAAALYLGAAGALSSFGVIHSVRADGSAYALWQLEGPARVVATQFCLSYVVLAAALMLLSLQRGPAGRHRP
jgi:AGZA family xanthine/uracil permease-like MFS transporter